MRSTYGTGAAERGRKLKQMREAVGLSQSQLGVKVGWNVVEVSMREMGVRDAAGVRYPTARLLAEALGLSVDRFACELLDLGSWSTENSGKTFGEARRAVGLTQRELAEVCDSAWRTVWRWESGESPLSNAELWRVALVSKALRRAMPK